MKCFSPSLFLLFIRIKFSCSLCWVTFVEKFSMLLLNCIGSSGYILCETSLHVYRLENISWKRRMETCRKHPIKKTICVIGILPKYDKEMIVFTPLHFSFALWFSFRLRSDTSWTQETLHSCFCPAWANSLSLSAFISQKWQEEKTGLGGIECLILEVYGKLWNTKGL